MIEAIAFAPDGYRVAVLASDGYLRIYDASTRGLLSSTRYGSYLGGGLFSFGSAVWRRDGRLVVSGMKGGAVLDLEGHPVEPFPADVLQLRRTTDGSILGVDHGRISVFGARSFHARTDDVSLMRLATTPDGKTVAWIGGALDDTLRIAEVETLPVHRRIDVGFIPGGIALARDGKTAFVGSQTPIGGGEAARGALFEVSLSDPQARPIQRIEGEGSFREVKVSPDDRYVVGASDALVVWDRLRGTGWRRSWQELEARPSVESGGFGHVAFSEDSRWLAATTLSAVHIFDLRSGRYMGTLGEDVRPSYYVEFRDDTRLLSATRLGLTEWSVQEGRVLRRDALPGAVVARLDDKTLRLASTTDGCGDWQLGFHLWTATETGDGREMEAEMESELHCLQTGELDEKEQWTLGRSSIVAYTRIANDRNDTELVVRDLADGKQRVLPESTNAHGFRFSPDDQKLVAFLGDLYTEQVAVWSVAQNRKSIIASLPAPTTFELLTPQVASFSPDSHRVGVVRGPRMWVWNIAAGRPEIEAYMPLGPAAELALIAFAPDNETWFAISSRSEIAMGRGTSVIAHHSPLELGPTSFAVRGDRIALATRDGGIRILDHRTLAERANLVEFEDDEDIAVTPSGWFRGTTEAAQRVALVYPQPTELFRVDRLTTDLHAPERVGRVLRGETPPAVTPPARPPRLHLTGAPALEGTRARASVVTARTARVRVFGEGRQVLDQPCAGACTLSFETLPGIRRYDVIAFDDARRSSNPIAIELPETRHPGGGLWILAAGISDYPRLDGFDRLRSADADACEIAETFSAIKGTQVRKVATLINSAVTTQSVLDVLQQFEAMGPDDLGVLFFSGHSVRGPDGDSIFLTSGVEAHQGVAARESTNQHGIHWSSLAGPLRRLRGRVLIMLDTCHSGGFGQQQVITSSELADDLNRDARAGVVVFASSKGRQRSAEVDTGTVATSARTCSALPRDPRAGGLFRRAVVDVLADSKQHDLDGDGLRVSELAGAVSFRVHRQTDGAQTPWVARRETFADFLLVPTTGAR